MRLFIAEKPSVAKSLAAVIGATSRGDGFMHGNHHAITWCFGHLFEDAAPNHYNPAFKTWRMEDLPITPQDWVVLPKDNDSKKQLRIIGNLIKDADDIVNAGDPDNEGQLLVDEVLEHFKNRKPVLRFWASAQDRESMIAALNAMQDNRNFVGFRDAARARKRADWLIGMNFSRAFTLRHQAAGGMGVISVGRVQTPTLQIVASRDEAIANFVPRPFYVLRAQVEPTKAGAWRFWMRWKPAASQHGLDEEGRLVDPKVADGLVTKLTNALGRITEYSTQRKTEHQPAGLSLTGVTLKASNAWGYNASEVLEACQALYETHKLTSYPRTDCEYMPEVQHGAAAQILAAVAANLPAVAEFVGLADPSARSRIWDDTKITAHHAIVPTGQRADAAGLGERERNVYQLIATNYLAQFFPVHAYLQTTIVADFAGETFAASGRTVIDDGWKQLYVPPAQDDDEKEAAQALPALAEGDAVQLRDLARSDRMTRPPARFTEATLVVAMENIYKFIEEEADKKSLKDGDGIGTPATRAAILKELRKRGFLAPQGKFIVSTEEGRAALAALPPEIKSAALTAAFQRQLKEIERGEAGLDRFVRDQARFVADQVDAVRGAMPRPKVYGCPECAGNLRRIQRRDKSAWFWSCAGYSAGCLFTAPDDDGAPSDIQPAEQSAQ